MLDQWLTTIRGLWPNCAKVPALEDLVWKNGVRVESNRDLKLMYGYWRTQLMPWIRPRQQSRLNRISATQATARAAGTPWAPPVFSAWSFIPSAAHDLGGTLRDHLSTSKYPSDLLARVVVGLEGSIEIKRTLVFAASENWYILYTLNRRPNRNYLELRSELNTGQLLQLDRGGVQHSIVIKWQRGEQFPTFNPVNSLSIGPKLYF